MRHSSESLMGDRGSWGGKNSEALSLPPILIYVKRGKEGHRLSKNRSPSSRGTAKWEK